MQCEDKKKGTKLSLTKKAPKSKVSSSGTNKGIQELLLGNVDLNETCEFKDPVHFPGSGNSNAQLENGKRFKTVLMATKDKVSEKIYEKTKDSVKCQFCHKNLNHLTVQRREQHVNKCIDQAEFIEKQEREEKQVLEAAKTAILDCPMCGKHFKTENGRLTHLKKCCQEVGVSTEKMIQLVKEQEQERQIQIAAGIIPQQLKSKITKSVATKKRKLKEPKSQFEEDVQVAMAMSSSLSSSASDNITSAKRKKNRNEKLDDVCLLTTLTDEDRQKRIEEKVSSVLHMANNRISSDIIVLQESSLKTDSFVDKLSLWGKSMQEPITCNNEQFYVGALIPPLSVSNSEPGKNLRRLSSIPGRDKSLVVNDKTLHKSELNEQLTDDIITASTQTAVVLAELAVDDTDILDTTAISHIIHDSHHTDNLSELQASGFCVEAMVLNEKDKENQRTQTLSDYKRMVNNKQCSDVTVTSSCGEKFYAHQVILAARCPQLLQMLEDSVITLDYTPDIVLTFLNYIYTGDITLTPSAQTELLRLANQLQFISLEDACKKVVVQKEISDTVDLNDNKESSETEFVESKLDMKEIWGESDSEINLNEDDQGSNEDRSFDNDINENDCKQISYTQHCKLRSKVSQSDTDVIDSDVDDVIDKCKANELAIQGYNPMQAENECDSVSKVLTDKNNDYNNIEVELDIETNHYEEDMNCDTSPCSKRIRLSGESKFLKDTEIYGTNQGKFPNEENRQDICEEKTDNGGYSESISQMNIDEEIPNDAIGMNSSAVDLFDSPSPRRPIVTDTVITKANKTLTYQNDTEKLSNISTKPENKYNSTQSHNRSTNQVTAVIEIDTDSTQEDLDNENNNIGYMNINNADDNADQWDNFNDSVDKSCDQFPCDTENVKQNNNCDAVQSNQTDKSFKVGSDCKLDSTLDGSDDDLQITGDNLDELIQHSPTFHNHKTSCSSNKVKKSELETKYLGLKSFTEGVSDRKNDSYLDYPLNDENKQSLLSSKDSEQLHTDDCHMLDKKADNTYDKDVSFTDVKRKHDDHDLEISDEDCDMNPSPGIYDRRSEAYGKHEISVYTNDADTVGTPDSSFKVDNAADVWEDFYDCGMGYEQPDVNVVSMYDDGCHENKSTLIGYQQSAESPEEMSSVIPVQDVIDLSQNEDDNDISEKQVGNDVDNALLEDGEDSFVFQVNDQLERRETPSTKIQRKKDSFKTPSVVAKNHGKKHQWIPPSPFTPMPEYGSMSTPALKKAVNKYGVKPVGKKRMIKVLEDIYHQTHQYETDSDCEEEVEIEKAVSLTGAGDTLNSDSLPSSQGDLSSQDSDISDVLEESCLHMSSDSETSLSPQKNIDVTKQLFQFVKTRSEIQAKILMFEPLELDVLKKDIKDSGIKCSMDKLMDFLDERCIAFTSKNTRKRQTGRRGKQKTAKSKSIENQCDK